MNNIKLSKRQENILKIIVKEYNNYATAIGSNFIIEKYFPSLSSATIRNDMVILEKNNLINKHYASSGRIPTLEGYKFYNDYLDFDIITDRLKIKMNDILSNRNLSINEVIDKSVEIINNNINLPSIILNNFDSDLLRKIDLIQISNNFALIIIITSSGEIIKREIRFSENDINMDDVVICVAIFNDRLIDTPINQIKDKLVYLENIIRTKIKNHEYFLQEIINKIFMDIKWNKHTVKDSNNLLTQPEFSNVDKLKKVLNLLEDVSIWQQLSLNSKMNKNKSITFTDNIGIDGISAVSTNINVENSSHQISIVGPNRVTYAKAKSLLKFLKDEIENNYNKKEFNENKQ